jgi:hypothetical protein
MKGRITKLLSTLSLGDISRVVDPKHPAIAVRRDHAQLSMMVHRHRVVVPFTLIALIPRGYNGLCVPCNKYRVIKTLH